MHATTQPPLRNDVYRSGGAGARLRGPKCKSDLAAAPFRAVSNISGTSWAKNPHVPDDPPLMELPSNNVRLVSRFQINWRRPFSKLTPNFPAAQRNFPEVAYDIKCKLLTAGDLINWHFLFFVSGSSSGNVFRGNLIRRRKYRIIHRSRNESEPNPLSIDWAMIAPYVYQHPPHLIV